ncbi:MAG: hypothetical protein JWO38_5605 [Gemmataceae bacterium]|nr:hypothetical protein [Gemmataceae bacterium]
MIGAIASGSINTAVNLAQQATQTLGVASTTAGGDTDGDGNVQRAGKAKGDQAQISSAGQLFGQLQQLQSQDPAKFKQLLSDVANQLTSAAQQTTGAQSQLLSNLASTLQNAASSGNLAALQPHHAHHGQGTYNQQGQVTPTSSLSTSNPSTDTTSTGVNLQQLLTNITTSVTQALGG